MKEEEVEQEPRREQSFKKSSSKLYQEGAVVAKDSDTGFVGSLF